MPVRTSNASTSASLTLACTRLFGDGKHGQTERIQTFRGPACHTTFSARRYTALYRLKTPSQQVAMVLSARACGLDPSEARRVFGYRQATIITWLNRAGRHAESLHERCFRNLHLPHLQLDELRTRLHCATQVRLSVAGHRSRHQDFAHAPSRAPHAAHGTYGHPRSAREPGRLSVFRFSQMTGSTSTSMRLAAHFGKWLQVGPRGRKVKQWQVEPRLIYGQVKKCYRRRKLVKVRHVMRLGTEEALTVALQRMGFSGRQNQTAMDGTRSARLPLAAGLRLSAAEAGGGCCVMAFGGV